MPAVAHGRISTCCAVEVAKAHIRAAEVGHLGERYVLAGETVSWAQLFETFGAEIGVDTSTITIVPAWALQALGTLYDAVSVLLNRPLSLSSEMADMLVGDLQFVCWGSLFVGK